MITAALAFFASMKAWPWRLIGVIAVAVVVLGSLYFFGRYLYALGVREENERWEERVEKLETRAEEIADEAERNHRQVTSRINSVLTHETEHLEGFHDAADLDFMRAWAGADSRLLHSADSGGDRRA